MIYLFFSVILFLFPAMAHARSPLLTPGAGQQEASGGVYALVIERPRGVVSGVTPWASRDVFENTIAQAKEIAPDLKREETQEESNIFHYRDNYFLFGNPASKVQFSFKMRPLLNFDLYMAYTQLMFWRITADSAPFEDITFNPEIFYAWTPSEFFFREMKFGLEHKSNGKASTDSRSLNRTFTELNTDFGWQRLRVFWDLRLFWIYDYDHDNNGDIKKYMGFWTMRFTVDGLFEQLFPSKSQTYIQFNPGGTAGNEVRFGAIEVGIRTKVRLFHLMPYLMFQYYGGYMESMLTYNKLTHSFRVGFLL